MPRAARTPSPTANRTDLATPTTPTAAPGQEYGAAGAQLASQGEIPTAGGQNVTPGGGAPQPDHNAMLAALGNAPQPGSHGPIDRPTERPNEPVTHGLPVGPGGGPEALTGIGAMAREGTLDQAGTLSNLLTNMAASPDATSAIRYLAGRAAQGVL